MREPRRDLDTVQTSSNGGIDTLEHPETNPRSQPEPMQVPSAPPSAHLSHSLAGLHPPLPFGATTDASTTVAKAEGKNVASPLYVVVF